MEVNRPKCPVCGYQTPLYGDDKNKQKMDEREAFWYKRHIKHHITVKAKSELWQKHIGIELETPHLDYFDKQKKTIIKKVSLQIDI